MERPAGINRPGIRPENLRHYEHPAEKLALLQTHRRHRIPLQLHRSEWGELEGIANRTAFDPAITQHAQRC